MKAYLITSGALFALVTAAHVWRVIEEGSHLATDPWFIFTTLASAALSLWAWRVLRGIPRA